MQISEQQSVPVVAFPPSSFAFSFSSQTLAWPALLRVAVSLPGAVEQSTVTSTSAMLLLLLLPPPPPPISFTAGPLSAPELCSTDKASSSSSAAAAAAAFAAVPPASTPLLPPPPPATISEPQPSFVARLSPDTVPASASSSVSPFLSVLACTAAWAARSSHWALAMAGSCSAREIQHAASKPRAGVATTSPASGLPRPWTARC
jgi:hypothetical protein